MSNNEFYAKMIALLLSIAINTLNFYAIFVNLNNQQYGWAAVFSALLYMGFLSALKAK